MQKRYKEQSIFISSLRLQLKNVSYFSSHKFIQLLRTSVACCLRILFKVGLKKKTFGLYTTKEFGVLKFPKMKTTLPFRCCLILLWIAKNLGHILPDQLQAQCAVEREEIIRVQKLSPAQIDCYFLIESAYLYPEFDEHVECIIFDGDLNEVHIDGGYYNYEYELSSFIIQSVTHSMNFSAYLIHNNNSCSTAAVRIIAKERKKQLSCGEEMQRSIVAGNYVAIKHSCNTVLSIDCVESKTVSIPQVNSTIIWYRNCVQLNHSKNIAISSNLGALSTITLKEQEIITGNYSCLRTYNGLSTFIRLYNVQLEDCFERTFPTWKTASNLRYTRIGDKVTLECLGAGDASAASVGWFKQERAELEPLCLIPFPIVNGSYHNNGSYACYTTTYKEKVKTSDPSTQDMEIFKLHYSSFLNIRNFQVSDVGKYFCTLSSPYGLFKESTSLKLKDDSQPRNEFKVLSVLFGNLLEDVIKDEIKNGSSGYISQTLTKLQVRVKVVMKLKLIDIKGKAKQES